MNVGILIRIGRWAQYISLPCFLLAILSLTFRTKSKAEDKPSRADFCPFSAAKGSVSASLPGSRIREPSRNRTPRPLRRLLDCREEPPTEEKIIPSNVRYNSTRHLSLSHYLHFLPLRNLKDLTRLFLLFVSFSMVLGFVHSQDNLTWNDSVLLQMWQSLKVRSTRIMRQHTLVCKCLSYFLNLHISCQAKKPFVSDAEMHWNWQIVPKRIMKNCTFFPAALATPFPFSRTFNLLTNGNGPQHSNTF